MALNIFNFFEKKAKRAPKETAGSGSSTMERPAGQILAEGMMNIRDIVAPSAIEVDFNNIKVGNMFYRILFVSGYPRFVGANWLSPIINFEHSLDISMFYYPVKSKVILDDLRRKITELEATTMSNREKGRISDPVVTAALEDAQALQEQLVKGVEKYFQFSFYIKVPAQTEEELDNICSKLESTLGSLLLISKSSSLQMEEAFQSTVPSGLDKLLITRNMDTTSLATTFPFTSSDLTMEDGIMYGINRHNGSLIIFERFSLENANSVIFAKSGSGKSYFVKLEALRLMVFGAEVLVIDPEEEYRPLCEAVGGNYINFSANSPHKINPFDLSGIATEGENELGQKLISLVTLLKLMLGGMNPTEEAILDRALIETYRIKGITMDPETQMTKEPPVMEDLYKVLRGADEPEAKGMSDRLEKFIRGSMTGIFDSQSSINLNSKMTVFSTKHMEEALRPIAFYMILDFIWTRIRRDLRKRILIVEEAWYLMQNEDSARFIYGIAKRARKYYLGLTTISQDVDDFLQSEYGKAIVTNSSIQVLLKQHPAAIDRVAETFYLSEGEKRLLLAADKGEGLFFAGAQHVAMKVIASEAENKLITTNPEEILKLRQEGKIGNNNTSGTSPVTPARPKYTQFKTIDPNEYTTMDSAGKPNTEFENVGMKSYKDSPPSPSQQTNWSAPKPTQTDTSKMPSSSDILKAVDQAMADQKVQQAKTAQQSQSQPQTPLVQPVQQPQQAQTAPQPQAPKPQSQQTPASTQPAPQRYPQSQQNQQNQPRQPYRPPQNQNQNQNQQLRTQPPSVPPQPTQQKQPTQQTPPTAPTQQPQPKPPQKEGIISLSNNVVQGNQDLR